VDGTVLHTVGSNVFDCLSTLVCVVCTSWWWLPGRVVPSLHSKEIKPELVLIEVADTSRLIVAKASFTRGFVADFAEIFIWVLVVGGDDLTGALRVLFIAPDVATITSIVRSSNKFQDGVIQVLANPGPPGNGRYNGE